jgi:cytochrome bd-type quinol oxidase subunit 1
MSIGLALFVAIRQTLHGREVYLRITRFWDRLLLVAGDRGVIVITTPTTTRSSSTTASCTSTTDD